MCHRCLVRLTHKLISDIYLFPSTLSPHTHIYSRKRIKIIIMNVVYIVHDWRNDDGTEYLLKFHYRYNIGHEFIININHTWIVWHYGRLNLSASIRYFVLYFSYESNFHCRQQKLCASKTHTLDGSTGIVEKGSGNRSRRRSGTF